MAAAGSPERAKRLGEWLLRRQALQAARAELPGSGELAARAFDQVRLLRAIARQLAESADDPAGGRRPAVLLSLHRDRVYWTLVAGAPPDRGVSPDLAGLWQQAPRDKLLRAAGNEPNLEAVHRLLFDTSPLATLDANDGDVGRVAAFADALYEDLAAPRRRVARVVAQRWLRLGAAAAAVVAIALVIRAITAGPNLAARATMRVSAPLPGCAADAGCADLLFHTNQENSPWVQFDLGAPTRVHLVDIRNRPDCCQERAVPLVVEVSTDGAQWKEVARQNQPFKRWKATFPRTDARYVKLRALRATMFGFAGVEIR